MAEEKKEPKLILTVDEDQKITWHTRDMNLMLMVANDVFIDTIRYEAIEHYKRNKPQIKIQRVPANAKLPPLPGKN